MKVVKIPDAYHTFYKSRSAGQQCKMELYIEAVLALGMRPEHQPELLQTLATLKNNAKIAHSESKAPDPSEAMQSTVLEAQAATSRKTALSSPAGACDTSLVWEAYCESYFEHWGIRPARNVKVNSAAKKLVSLIGVEDAIAIARYYPSRQNPYYIRRGHPFELLLTEELVLRREIQSGLKFTPKLIDKIVDAEQSAETAKTMQFEPLDPFDLSPSEHTAPVFLQKGKQQ